MPELRRTDRASVDKNRLVRPMAAYTGYLPGVADTSGLVPSSAQFARLLLADRGLRLGHYDSRRTGPLDPPDQPYDPNTDPSLQGPPPPNGTARYLRDELGYRSDLQYAGPFGGVYPPASGFRGDWMSVRWKWAPGELADSVGSAADLPLRRAMAANPDLKVFAACGYYDLICAPAANAWVRDHLPADLQRRVAVAGYHGGHATYLDTDARSRLKTDVACFFGLSVSRD